MSTYPAAADVEALKVAFWDAANAYDVAIAGNDGSAKDSAWAVVDASGDDYVTARDALRKATE
jgi:hypothetical protein